MTCQKSFATVAPLVMIGLCTCGGSHGDVPPKPAPEFSVGGGDPSAPAYPAGPYGITKKTVIRNYEFVGFAYPALPAGRERLLPISFADFYNPTGTDTFPEGTSFTAGAPKPKALTVVLAARWCGPCQAEAKDLLPGKYAELKPRGGEFLLDLAQNLSYQPAEMSDLRIWTKQFNVDYPSIIDPMAEFSSLFDSSAFPSSLLVRTRDMTIVDAVTGSPDPSFWVRFEEILAEEPVVE